MLNELIESILDKTEISSEKIKVSPGCEVCLIPNWRDKKDLIKESCAKMNPDPFMSKDMLIQKSGLTESAALLLIAIGNEIGIWERFPSTEIEWNLPHWPTIQLIQQPDRQ